MPELTAERLRELFNYNSETGIFISKIVRGRIPAGITPIPKKREDGSLRVFICIDRRIYRAHRLAWLYVYGEWPSSDIDHKDGDSSNNAIGNLRLATDSQNLGNCKKPITNKSGFKGVSWHSAGKKWQAHIKVQGVNHYLGLFETKESAHEAYKNAAIAHRGEFARWE